MIRIALVVVVCMSAFFGPSWIFFVTTGLFAIRYCAYEALVIAALIDAYFSLGGFPVYLVSTTAGVLLIEWLKPKVLLYTD